MMRNTLADAELERLRKNSAREQNWQRWGPYLAERQWSTVREDYSPDGNAWAYFSCLMGPVIAPAMGAKPGTIAIPISAIFCSSMSTLMAIPDAVWGQVIRQAGPV